MTAIVDPRHAAPQQDPCRVDSETAMDGGLDRRGFLRQAGVAATGIGGASAAAAAGPDRILRGGVVGGRGAMAVAMRGGRIVAAGDEAAVMALARPGVTVVDLAGAQALR
jgi:hypothetical protein